MRKYTTRTGQNIEMVTSLDVEQGRKINAQWVVHEIAALVDGERAGVLRISFVPQSKMDEHFPSMLNFSEKGSFPYKKSHVHWRDLSIEEKRRVLLHVVLTPGGIRHKQWDIGYHSQSEIAEMDHNQADHYLALLDNPSINKAGKEEYDRFVAFHVDRPLVDFIRVKEHHRRNGIGLALYQAGAEWLATEFGMSLHASGIQSDEARAAWEKMDALGWVSPAPNSPDRKVLNVEKIFEPA